MPKAYIIAGRAISYRRYITRSVWSGYHCKRVTKRSKNGLKTTKSCMTALFGNWNLSNCWFFLYEFFHFLIFFTLAELKHQIVYCLLSTVLITTSFDEPALPCRRAELIDLMCSLYIAQLPAQMSQSFDKYKVVSK